MGMSQFDASQPIDWNARLAWWCEETGQFYNTHINPDYPMAEHPKDDPQDDWCGVMVPPLVDPSGAYSSNSSGGILVYRDGTIDGDRHFLFNPLGNGAPKRWCLVNRYPEPTVQIDEALQALPGFGEWA